MMKRTIPPPPAQPMDSHRPARCYHRTVQEVAGHQRQIGGGVLGLAVVVVQGLLTAGFYYPAPTFMPPMPSDGTDGGDGPGTGSAGADAAVCFGTEPFRVCLKEAPNQPLSISGPGTTIDTTANCVATVLAGSQGCVMAGTTISIDATLRATGPRPLVLIASEKITILGTGVVDVGSHRGATLESGAGAMDCANGQPPDRHGGGAGGSFLGLGGTGGPSVSASGGTPGPVVTDANKLRGGGAVQDTPGPTGPNPVRGGHGGGAVLLIAGQSISVDGAINAAGEGGEGGPPDFGGGGGGSGGMIVLYAPTITGNGLILASGGGGGG